MKELNKNGMLYRGLGNLTYNEVMERKYRNLKSTIIALVCITVLVMAILFMEGLLGYESEYDHGYTVGMLFGSWFFACISLTAWYVALNNKYELRLKELEE